MNLGTLFDRTPQGLLEIRHRSRTLTQSERQVLIWVNGKRNIGELYSMSSVIRSERINLALDKLLKNGFVYEIMMAEPIGELDEEVSIMADEPSVEEIDNYLRKDANDPVTIMANSDYLEDLTTQNLSAPDETANISSTATASATRTTSTTPTTSTQSEASPSVSAAAAKLAGKDPDRKRYEAFIDAEIGKALDALRDNAHLGKKDTRSKAPKNSWTKTSEDEQLFGSSALLPQLDQPSQMEGSDPLVQPRLYTENTPRINEDSFMTKYIAPLLQKVRKLFG